MRPTGISLSAIPTGVVSSTQPKGFTVSQRRTLILVAAIAIGALGSFLVWNYVNGVKDDANKGSELVSVYLVKQAIPRGTSGVEAVAYIKKDEIPQKIVPGNAITDPRDISGQVALNALVPNTVVVSDMFVDPSDPNARSSFSDRLNRINNEDQVAVTISVDQVRGVAGLIQPGDFVNVMVSKVTEIDAEGNPLGLPPDAEVDKILFAAQARYLYQKVEVLAVGQNAVPMAGVAIAAETAGDPNTIDGGAAPASPNAAQDAGLITLIVPTKAAQYIASVAPENLYLVMVARDYKPVQQQTIDLNAPIPAENPAQLTPYGPKGPEASGN